MTESELIDALRLQTVPNIGNINAKKLIAHCGSPSAVFKDKMHHLLKIDGIGRHTLSGVFNKTYLYDAEEEYAHCVKNKIRATYFMDEGYPEYLKHCIDGPIVLFQKGNINLNHRKVISVVGTRNITGYGTRFCEQFIAGIAPLNPIIVSGFAYGVDIAIHRAAMEHGLQTIACMAHGLNQVYPKVHAKYCSEVMENGGFVSEFWSSSNPDRENFLKRNRIIAGMSEATLVVESAEKGGSLVTADLANGYNREVFAVPGRYSDRYSKGCNDLIKRQKAHLLTSAAELVYLLGWEIEEKKETHALQRQLFIELDGAERTIYDYLQQNGKQQLDTVALQCKMPVFKVSSTLLEMEMKGVVKPLPGKLFEAI